MEAVYGWIENIIYYMIFLSVVDNPLVDSKYGKYIRFFSGTVLVLLVVSPPTEGLHLDEQISSMLKPISPQNDTGDLRQDLWGTEERCLDQVVREYKQTVAADMETMARAEGLECTGASVWIDNDRNSSRYGQVEGIGLVISGKRADTELGSRDYMGSRPASVDAGRVDSVKAEDVELGELPETGGVEDNGNTPEQGGGEAGGMAADKKINRLAGEMARYHRLEGSDIRI